MTLLTWSHHNSKQEQQTLTLAPSFSTIIKPAGYPNLLPVLDEFRILDWGKIVKRFEINFFAE